MEKKVEKTVKKQEKEQHKGFFISNWAITNRSTVFVLTFIILIGGVLAYSSMPKENFPEVITPEIYVGTSHPGNSPLDVEKLITRPLEKEINLITGIDEVTSTSVQGYSSINVKFNFDVSPTEALRKVKDKVDIARSGADFPDLLVDPNIFEMNFSELMPVMNINLYGDFSLDQLKDYAEYLEDKIEDIPEISKVDIRGVTDKEMGVEVDLRLMKAMQVSFMDIENAIRYGNMTVSSGDIKDGDFRRTMRVLGEIQNAEELENLIIKQEFQDIIYLKDIAQVRFIEKERESYARESGKTVVMLDIIKRAGENLISASEQIQDVLDEAWKNHLPETLEYSITMDQSDATETQVDELENSIIFGVLLVVLVLLFFLGLRNALFVGVAIPLSMFMSFLILSSMGVTLNVIVLFALVLALGMLVDNGIVVVENVYRLMDEGLSPIKAAKQGVGEVAWPIIASTATTLGAFVPLALWPGMMGEFMQYLPLTLMIVLGSSLFVALIINPVLTTVFMKIKEDPMKVNNRQLIITAILLLLGLGAMLSPESVGLGYIFFGIGLIMVLRKYPFITKETKFKTLLIPIILTTVFGILYVLTGSIGSGNLLFITAGFLVLNFFVLNPGTRYFQNRIIPILENAYERFLSKILIRKRPLILLFGIFMLLIVSGGLMGIFPPKVEFFPANEPQYLNIFIEKPIGTDIEETNKFTQKVEEEVMFFTEGYNKKNPEFVQSIIAQVGNGTSDPMQGPSLNSTSNKARISVSFVKYQSRDGIKTNDYLNELRGQIKERFPEANITVSKNEAGPPQGAPINLEMIGDDYEQLLLEAEKVKVFINDQNIPGIEKLKLDVESGKPELIVSVDKERANRFNLSTGQIGDVLRTTLYGKEISRYKEGEDDFPINIRAMEEYRGNAETVLDQEITFRNQSNGRIVQVPISAVTNVRRASTFSSVKRKDLKRVITIASNVTGDANANEVVEKIKEAMRDYDMPQEIDLKYTGQQEEQSKEMSFLSTALMIAVVLILFIIVAQFNSVSTPIIIGAAVFFSLIGVLLGLVITGKNFVIIMTMIGIISLAGIVVNNAIVLIDYTNILIGRKKEELGLSEKDRLPMPELLSMIIQGGKTRLRPVLLTAITTILGLVPLAAGLNINFISMIGANDPQTYVGGDNVIFWGPMSWTIIFGLTFATFLTLIVVPAMFLLIQKIKYNVSSI